jgi:hypothetical protein
MQNKLIVLLLLANCATAQDKPESGPAPKLGKLPNGAETPEVSKELKEVMKPRSLEAMTIPPAKVESKMMK